MNQFRMLGLTAAIGALLLVAAPASSDADAVIAGWAETAWISNGRTAVAVKAKLDTGAASSSIHAPGYQRFTKQGAAWVRFELSDAHHETVPIERPVLRVVRIRRANAPSEQRPVIGLTACVAGKTGEGDFTLADRTGMDFQILIGRNFLGDRILVNSNRSYLGEGKCRF